MGEGPDARADSDIPAFAQGLGMDKNLTHDRPAFLPPSEVSAREGVPSKDLPL